MSAEAKELVSSSEISQEPAYTEDFESFHSRHIGPSPEEIEAMLTSLGVSSLEELCEKTLPESIRLGRPLNLRKSIGEFHVLRELEEIAAKNKVFRSYIGLGFYNCITPPVILRNIMENPGWYTQYTPYQPEISQGRLEALINFQTMVCDLTGMNLANASLLDEGTAAAEAMTLSHRQCRDGAKNRYFVDENVFPTTLDVLKTRAEPLGIELQVGAHAEFKFDERFFGALIQYPAADGALYDYRLFVEQAHKHDAIVTAATDLMALVLLTPPGEWGADIAIGNTQRFGVPLGFGGPHAAFLATKEEYKREIPGRIVGVSKDNSGKASYRLALQTREQHIRRERATSNICTAQVLLAIMAGMFAVYHGPERLKRIAERIHQYTWVLAKGLTKLGVELVHGLFFDTIRTKPLGGELSNVLRRAEEQGI